jgi:Mg2+ transporter MgtE
LQPDELLLARDLLNKQIVDTQGMKVVRVNDLKLSQSGRQLRLLGAEVGVRGLLRSLSPMLEKFAMGITKLFGSPMEERIIAWNYMELVDRDLSNVKLSVTHKRLHELHPADVADILEQLDPQQRAKVFDHLDAQQAAQTMSELGDEFQTDIIGEMAESEASELLASMDPDDAADILGDLPYEKAEKLLWLMGVQDQRRIRALLGYKDKTAGGIMTPETVTVSEDATVAEVIEKIRTLSENEDLETVHYVYLLGQTGELSGALSLRSLVLATPDTKAAALATRDLVTAGPDTDQEEVAELISKYDLLAVPVVDEGRHLLGIVTVDDAMDVIEEEHVEDLTIAGAGTLAGDEANTLANKLKWLLRRGMWLVLWTVVALMVLMSGGFALFASALVLVPFVLVFADNTVTLSINDLLDYDGTKSAQSTRRLLVRNTIIALLLAVIGIAAAVLLRGAFASAQINDTETWGILSALAAALITVVAVMLLAVLVTMRGRRQLDKGRSLSNTTTTLLIMLLSLGMQFALTYAFHGIIVL